MTFEDLKNDLADLTAEQLKQNVTAVIGADFDNVILSSTREGNVFFMSDLDFSNTEESS